MSGPADEGVDGIDYENDLDDDDTDDLDANRIPGATAHDVLEYLVRSIVDEPDSVTIESSEQRNRVRFDVHVADGDMGRVIGRRGRTAQAIRAVVRAAAARDHTDVEVEFVD